MTPILFALALQAAAPAAPEAAATPSAAPASAPAPEATPAEKLAGLEQVYSTTCGQTGILYHAYDDLCDGLNKQIRSYRAKVDRDEAKARAAAAAAAAAKTKP